MGRKCSCNPKVHVPCVGSDNTAASAEYTPELCDAHADLVLDAFHRVAVSEWELISKTRPREVVRPTPKEGPKLENAKATKALTKTPPWRLPGMQVESKSKQAVK